MTFEEAFREINGRAPTVEETKRALAIRRVVREADLDPVLLFFLADANAAAERDRLPGTVQEAVDAGVRRIETAIPTNTEWAKAASWAAWFAKKQNVMLADAEPLREQVKTARAELEAAERKHLAFDRIFFRGRVRRADLREAWYELIAYFDQPVRLDLIGSDRAQGLLGGVRGVISMERAEAVTNAMDPSYIPHISGGISIELTTA